MVWRACKAASTPIYAKYEKAVEEELTRARANGANPPRELVLDFVIGKAVREGNFKAKTPAKAAIPRGKTPGARSDTTGRASGTEHQKRAARLANVII